jgi:hypothetical protein
MSAASLPLTALGFEWPRFGATPLPPRALALACTIFLFGDCGAAQPGNPTSSAAPANAVDQPERSRLRLAVGGQRFAITLADTDAARAFAALLPLSVDMADLNANEKHAELPQALPASSSRPGTIRAGDLMLYGSKTLVVFYKTFDSPYSYTRIGRIDGAADLAKTLGSADARLEFSRP